MKSPVFNWSTTPPLRHKKNYNKKRKYTDLMICLYRNQITRQNVGKLDSGTDVGYFCNIKLYLKGPLQGRISFLKKRGVGKIRGFKGLVLPPPPLLLDAPGILLD